MGKFNYHSFPKIWFLQNRRNWNKCFQVEPLQCAAALLKISSLGWFWAWSAICFWVFWGPFLYKSKGVHWDKRRQMYWSIWPKTRLQCTMCILGTMMALWSKWPCICYRAILCSPCSRHRAMIMSLCLILGYGRGIIKALCLLHWLHYIVL